MNREIPVRFCERLEVQSPGPILPGAKDYVSDGKLTGGFAVLSCLAKYKDSGIMTFIVGKDGVIYEKDLGENTAQAAACIAAYNPGEGWSVCWRPKLLTPGSARGARKSKGTDYPAQDHGALHLS
jgi:hypothetical protein